MLGLGEATVPRQAKNGTQGRLSWSVLLLESARTCIIFPKAFCVIKIHFSPSRIILLKKRHPTSPEIGRGHIRAEKGRASLFVRQQKECF